MKKILITGGSGFVGSHIVDAARARGHEVVLLKHAEVPLEDRTAVEKFVAQVKPDVVIHPATSTLMSGKTANPRTLIGTNIEGAVNIMDASASAGVKAFVNIGSVAEYGPKDHAVKEDEQCNPVELYAVSKLAATLYGQGLAKRTGFPCVTMRLSTPYGPRIQAGRLVRVLIEKTRSGEEIPLSVPTITRDFIYVEDILPLLFEAVQNAEKYKGEIFNMGSGVRTSLQDFVAVVEKVLGKKANAKWNSFPVQSYDSEFWQNDMTKTFSHFAWRPTTSLEEGVRKTAQALD